MISFHYLSLGKSDQLLLLFDTAKKITDFNKQLIYPHHQNFIILQETKVFLFSLLLFSILVAMT